MKKLNKAIALISTGCMALMSAAPMYSSACGEAFNAGRNDRKEMPSFSHCSDKALDNVLRNYEKFSFSNKDRHDLWDDDLEMFWDKKNPQNVHAVEKVQNHAVCRVKKNVTEEELEKALEKFNKKHGTKYHCHKNAEKHGFKHKWDRPAEDVPTAPTTTAATTEAVAEATTAATTEAVTEATTVATTEAVTEATTIATTEAVIEATTVATTEAVTEATTVATTEAVTEATTIATTEAVIEATTVATTEAVAEATTIATTVTEPEILTDYEFTITVNDTDISFTMSEAKELYDYLKEEGIIEEFVYNADTSKMYTYATKVLNYYSVDYDSDMLYSSVEKLSGALESFIEENGAEYTVEYIDNMVTLVADGEINVEEELEFAEYIYDALGLYPYLDVSCEKITTYSDSVDMMNSVENDANADGIVNISDSVSILQSLSNPEKYGLTGQGEFNCDTEMDGVTGIDALAIQKSLTEK